jgi:antitoxin component of MazEF toxin-antitoxin module
MPKKVHKRSNNLDLRITTDYRSKEDSTIKIKIIENPALASAIQTSKWTLEELLAGINKSNIHQEVDTGFAVGNEFW